MRNSWKIREEEPRQIVALRILLPVDEIGAGVDRYE